MEVRLVVKKTKKGGKVFRFRGPDAVIGRAHGCTVRIPSSDVSREHCRLVVDGATVTVQDLGSMNGTLLNGLVIEGVQEVQPGDFLRVGPVIFTIEFDPAEAQEPQFEIVELVEKVEEEVLSGEDFVLEVSDDPDDRPLPLVDSNEPATISDRNPEVSQGWQIPEAADLRDLLSQLDEPPEPPRTPKKRKKKE